MLSRKDGKVIKEDISTPAKQKTFEKKYNLKIVAGTPPLLEYQTDSFSVMATKIITGSTKSISMPDTKPKKMEAWMDVQPKARKGKENLESFSPPVIIRDNEIRTESQSKLKEQTFREYDENGNKIPRLQILGTKEDEARIRERILTSTDGRSNSDIKEILVQFHEATSKRYGFVTYNDDKFYQADISSTENKLAFEKKYNVKLGK